MAGRGASTVRSRASSMRFMTVLASAVFEWLLIFMLFINAILAYLITKFAHYCELPIPCLLCSRLDHLLGDKRVRLYWDLMCGNHKSEISSLVLCNLHDKLVDVHGMCESCLFSFATKDKSNSETFRLLVGKLGTHPKIDVNESPLFDDDQKCLSLGAKLCCCCKKPWTSRHNVQTLLEAKLVELESADFDTPLTQEIKPYGDVSNNEIKSASRFASSSFDQGNVDDPLSHFGYSELKISSDTESEVQISDAEDLKALTSETHHSPKDLVVDAGHVKPLVSKLVDESISGKPIDLDEPSKLIDEEQCDLVESQEVPSTTPDAIGYGLEKLSWQQVELKAEPSPLPHLININGMPEPLSAPDTSVHLKDTRGIVEHKEIPADENNKGVNEVQTMPITSDLTGSRMNSDASDDSMHISNNLDLGAAYKLAISSRGRQLSGKLFDQLAAKDSTRVGEDLKLLLSTARGLDSPITGMMSPSVSGSLEGLKISDSSASGGLRTLQNRISLERNDSRNSLDRNGSGFESWTFITVSEMEGETELDRLKRQVDHDKQLLNSLFKELEEEKSASAVAVSQAMAMINKLQEEKATLQMEASHDIRMMEEQAEYDVKALERANDLLADKEREIQDLEAELDYYRIKYSNELAFDNEKDNPASWGSRHGGYANVSNYSVKKLDLSERRDGSLMDCKNSMPHSSWLEFEDERLYILRCLNDVEKKLYLFSNNGVYSDLNNQDYLEATGTGADSKEGSQPKDDTEDGELQKDNDKSIGSKNIRRVHSFENPKYDKKDPLICREPDVVALGYKVSCLSKRLQELEMDRKFLEHGINSLRNGEEGFRFIQEIASHLRELRSIGIKRNQPWP